MSHCSLLALASIGTEVVGSPPSCYSLNGHRSGWLAPLMKRTQAALRNAPYISQNLLTKILSTDAEEVTRRDLQLEVDTVTKIRTPYGPLIEFMELPVAEPQGDECSFSWCYANPFALLWELCRISKGFASLLEETYTNTSEQLHCITATWQ